jgi:hypothetical protein
MYLIERLLTEPKEKRKNGGRKKDSEKKYRISLQRKSVA